MGFPSVVDVVGYVSANSDNTSWTVFSGVDVNKGSVLLISADNDAGTDPDLTTASSDWTRLGIASSGTGVTSAIFYKTANATGDSFALTSDEAQQYSAILVRVSGPVTGIEGTSVTGTVDPPSHSLASGHTGNVTWLAFMSKNQNIGTAPSSGPSSYSGFTVRAGPTAGPHSAGAWRQRHASSENPGTFGGTGGGSYEVAWTIAVIGRRAKARSGGCL